MTSKAKITAAILVTVLGTVTSSTYAAIWVAPGSFDVNTPEGTVLEQTLTIGNDGPESLNFMIRTHIVGSSGESVKGIGRGLAAGDKIVSVLKNHDFTVLGDAPYKPGELIVRFADKADRKLLSTAEKNQILSPLGGGTVKRDFKIVPGLSVVELPQGMTVEEALQQFNGTDGILYAQPNYEVKALSTFPDDTRFDDLWGMHNTGQTGGTPDADIDAPEAWDISTGSSEVVVAVIDTGVDYTHPDLAANMWVNQAEQNGTPGVDDDGNGYVDDIYGYDFRNNDGDPMDDHYHGTHCSGTVGAVGNNSEGVAGVCWNVRIMAVKFLNSGGSGTTADAISSVEYSTLMGANLSSNSWGGGGYSQALKDAIDAAGAAGMLFVAAAGNEGSNNDTYPVYPASYDCESLIAVMATDRNDGKSSFSNYGPVSVDLGAPGSSILSCEPGSSYQYLSGTSMATPHVAGACVLLWSMNPALSNSEVKDILLQTVDETLPGLCVSEGRLNLYNAILETRAPWLEIEPQEGTIGPNSTVDVNVTFDAMELVPGIYEAEIVIISNDPCGLTIVPVTMTVDADDLVVSPDEDFESSGTRGGPFTPQCMTYTLTNNGLVPLSWTTSDTEVWLQVEPNEGVLDPNDSINVDVCITSDANLLAPNIYDQTLILENTDSNSIKLRLVTLTVKPPDLFTELFDTNDNDLAYTMLTFSPDGSGAYYEACREEVDEFPTEPNGGTFVSLWDDDYAGFLLGGGKEILFYGTCYNHFYIGSNGYITFGDGDVEFEPSLENHFNMPRISGIFTDLTPQDDQCISYKQLDDRVVVTFEDVQLYGDKNAKNSFQVEMFFADGTVRIAYLNLAAAGGLAGLSEGYGLPPFFLESNLSEYVPCWPYGDFDRNYSVDFKDFAVLAMHWLDENCGIPHWCEKTDLDFSSAVDIYDLDIFVENWLTVEDWWLQPVSHWKFDEGEGDTAYDSAGDNHGTIYGAEWTTGQIDSALDFDGVDDYVEVPDSPELRLLSTDFTVGAWIKPNKITGDNYFISKRNYDIRDGSGSNTGWGTKVCDGELAFGIFGTAAYYTTGANIQTDIWQHVTYVFDDSGNVISVYKNGSFLEDLSTGEISSSDKSVTIGATTSSSRGPYKPFDGKIDDVRIYDRALSAEEIWEIYREGAGNKAFNPNPADGATGVDPNTVLSWSPGKDAASHDVYLGTDFDDVNNATPDSNEYMGNYDVNIFDPCGLDLLTTYCWRIDEKNPSGTAKGDVWSFTTWLKSNLISWWKFDEGEGDTAYDSAGDNDGAVYGAVWTTGQIDGALDFNGISDYVDVGNDNSLKPALPVTLSAWIRLSSLGSVKYIVELDDNQTYYYGFWFYVRSENNLGICYGDGGLPDPANRRSKVGTTALSADSWYHVAVVIKGATDIDIYVNGADDGGTYSGTGGSLAYSSSSSLIGNSHGSDTPFDGKIDDVRIYDRALSAEEIWQLYQSGL